MPAPALSLEAFEANAVTVAAVMRAFANERRLMILCRLVERREASVNALAAEVGLGQSATSQHLAKMREEGIVAYRREGQTLWYRIADPRIARILKLLHDLYCRGD